MAVVGSPATTDGGALGAAVLGVAVVGVAALGAAGTGMVASVLTRCRIADGWPGPQAVVTGL